MRDNSRLYWIDNAKGLGIILVVLGHTYGIPVQMHHIIYSFHMPLFYILSGHTFRANSVQAIIAEQGISGYIKKQARTYLLPYFVLAALNFCGNILYELYCGTFSIDQQIRYIAGIFYSYANMDWMPMCSPIWFLPSIFLVKMLYTTMFLGKTLLGRYCIAIICAALSYGSYLLDIPRLPWNLIPSLFGVFFFHIGVELNQNNFIPQLRTHKAWFLSSIPLSLLCLPLASENLVGMNENVYGELWIFLSLSLLYSILLITLCPDRKTPLTWFGQNTLIFMAFNYLMRAYTVELYYLLPVIRNYPLQWPISFGMILVALTVIAYSCQKLFKR